MLKMSKCNNAIKSYTLKYVYACASYNLWAMIFQKVTISLLV